MTDTDTTTGLEIARGDLVLVTLSPSYAASWEAPSAYRGEDLEEDHRTFYATKHNDTWSTGYVTLVVPGTDPRHTGMWPLDPSRYGLEALELEGDHFGWDVLKRNVTPVVVPTSEEGPQEATEAPVTFSQEDVDRMVREATARTRTALLEEFTAWKERASEIACQYADDNNLCGEFERCMEDIGLEGRHREYVVSFSLTVSARNDESATAEAIEILASDTWALRNAHDDTEEV